MFFPLFIHKILIGDIKNFKTDIPERYSQDIHIKYLMKLLVNLFVNWTINTRGLKQKIFINNPY